MDLYLITHAHPDLAERVLAGPELQRDSVLAVCIPPASPDMEAAKVPIRVLNAMPVPSETASSKQVIDFDTLVDLIFTAERVKVL